MSEEALVDEAMTWARRSFCDPTTRDIISRLVRANAAQAAQLQACREALEPFAGFGIFLSGSDDYVAYQFYDLKLTTGDFRRAGGALSRPPAPTTEDKTV